MILGRRNLAHKLQVRRESTFGVGISREGTDEARYGSCRPSATTQRDEA